MVVIQLHCHVPLLYLPPLIVRVYLSQGSHARLGKVLWCHKGRWSLTHATYGVFAPPAEGQSSRSGFILKFTPRRRLFGKKNNTHLEMWKWWCHSLHLLSNLSQGWRARKNLKYQNVSGRLRVNLTEPFGFILKRNSKPKSSSASSATRRPGIGNVAFSSEHVSLKVSKNGWPLL